MKILFLTELTHSGGVDTFLATLLEHWPDHDDELCVMSNASHPGLLDLAARLKRRAHVSSHEISSYVDCVIQRESRRSRRNPAMDLLKRLMFALKGYFAFRRLFRQVKADRLVIVAGGYPGGDSCRIASLAWKAVAKGQPKAIYNFHGLASRASSWNLIEMALDTLHFRSVSAFVTVSEACVDSLRSRSKLWKTVQVRCILNGIVDPPTHSDGPAVRVEFGLEPDCLMVIMLATYDRNKGHDLLLDAFTQVDRAVPAARLVICGFGYENEVRYVEQGVKARGLSSIVKLMGYRRDASRILAAADILVLPTRTSESFGLAAAEAMSLGVPVIATRVGGLPEVVSHDHGGYLVEPNNAQELASYLIRLLENKTERDRQGQLGRERFLRHFTASRMAQQYANFIRNDVH